LAGRARPKTAGSKVPATWPLPAWPASCRPAASPQPWPMPPAMRHIAWDGSLPRGG